MNCALCGNEFQPKINEKYCSDDCRKAVKRTIEREKWRKANGAKKSYSVTCDTACKFWSDCKQTVMSGYVECIDGDYR